MSTCRARPAAGVVKRPGCGAFGRMLLGFGLLATTLPARAVAFSAADVREVVAADAPLMQSCYELFLAENPELAGQFTINFTVAAEGHVTAAVVEASTMRHSELEGCVLAVARNWQFPAPGEPVVVHYPFAFRPTAPPSPATATAAAAAPATTEIPPVGALPPSAAVDAPAPGEAAPEMPRKSPPSPYFILGMIAAMIVGLLVLLWLLRGRDVTNIDKDA